MEHDKLAPPVREYLKYRQVESMPRIQGMNSPYLPHCTLVLNFAFSGTKSSRGIYEKKRLALFRSKPNTNIIICSCLFK